jgi:FG-GAP-like repeat/Abnormal spindle-like microcephaly-assoc'd, ASPM-SPD-2-Hydin
MFSANRCCAPRVWRRIFLSTLASATIFALAAATFGSTPTAFPIITFVSPVSVNPGGADLTLTVNGANFVNGASVVSWNGTALVTTFVGTTKLTATVPATQTASSGTGWITVSNTSCSGECNKTSNVLYFPVADSVASYAAAELTATVGTGPLQLAAGDFNGDGKLDLAVSNYSGGTVSILLGNGDGTFQAQAPLTTISEPFGIAMGDLNGDGIPDLVVGNESSSGGLNIFLGEGSGGFTPGVALSGGFCLLEPVLADVNRDGNLDIVVGNSCGTGIEVYLGNGDGTFSAAIPVTGSGEVFGLILADFNGDGVLDLAAASYSTNLLDIYLGVGDGSFTRPSHLEVPDVYELVAGDIDGDGKVDLVASSEVNGGIHLLYGNGDGSFKPAVQITTGTYFGLAIGDLNGDGKLDVVSVSSSDVVQAWLNTGNGTFQTPQNLGSAFSYGVALGNFATQGGLNVAVDNYSASQVDLFLPTVVFSPSSKDFGSVGVGSSAQQVFTVTNASASTVTISAISFTGANPGDFSQTNNCTSPLAPAGSCSVTVTLAPAAIGSRAATLSINDNGPASPQTAALTGTGATAPVATLSPSALAFGSLALHVTSASQPVTLTNTGTASLMGVSIGVIGAVDFAQTNNCPAILIVSASCTVSVTFTPTVVGAESASLQFSDNAANSPQIVALSGAGLDVATQLNYVTAPPASVLAGSSIGSISVGIYDANSQLVTTSSASITVNIAGPNSFLQSQTRTASAGVASFDFSSVPLDVAGTYTVTASSTNLSSATSYTTVTPLLTAELMAVTGYPSPTYANVSHPFTISVTDSFGNPVTSYSGTVTLTSSDSGAVLTPSPYTFVGADMGTHTFTASFSAAGTQTVSATDGVLSGSQSGIVVNPRPRLVVNQLADDAGGSIPSCDGSVPCSLRSAINQANTLGVSDITFDTSQFSGAAPWTSTLTNGVPGLSSNLTITGPGSSQLNLSGNNLSSVFQVAEGAVVSIASLSVTEGNSAANGGGINNAGSLTLSNVAVTNSVAAQDGGGIYNSGSLTLNSSSVSGNTATGNGGGVASTGTSVFYDSTLSGNTATGNGGGIDNSGGLSIPQSTFYGNTAADGAALENEATGTLLMAQSTFSGNIAGSPGGTITNLNATQSAVTILNSIVAGNTASGGDCIACGTQLGFNLFNVPAATLKLGPLANNGGPTETMLPLSGSPAISAGSVTLAVDSGLPQSLLNDQRGAGYSRIVSNSVDLGSLQTNAGPPNSLRLAVSGSQVAGSTLSVTLTALTAGGNTDIAYDGTVHFTSSDAHAVLPADYTFLGSDNGTHVFAVTPQTSGAQSLTATDAGTSSLQASQSITESPAAAATVSATAGSGQSAGVAAAFSTALAAIVSDVFGNAVPNITVVFTAPSVGASGTFSGNGNDASSSVATNSMGIATAPAFTANGTAGAYAVTAAVQNLSPATYTLTNTSAGGYSIAANPASLTIVQGQSGSTVLTVTPFGGMSGTLAFACTGLPVHTSCAFAPAQAVMTGNNAVLTVALTVNTTPASLAASQPWSPGFPWTLSGSSALLIVPTGFLLLAIPQWRKGTNRQRYAYLSLLLLIGALTAAGMAGCGGASAGAGSDSKPSGGTPPGKYSVTAGASVNGSNTHSAMVTITITQ